jgi:hypothetical protein
MMLLITEDFITNEKKSTVIILSWFKERLEAGIRAKLVLRPNLISWLTQQVEQAGGGDPDSDLSVHRLLSFWAFI